MDDGPLIALTSPKKSNQIKLPCVINPLKFLVWENYYGPGQ